MENIAQVNNLITPHRHPLQPQRESTRLGSRREFAWVSRFPIKTIDNQTKLNPSTRPSESSMSHPGLRAQLAWQPEITWEPYDLVQSSPDVNTHAHEDFHLSQPLEIRWNETHVLFACPLPSISDVLLKL